MMVRAAIFWLSPVALMAAFGAVQSVINGDKVGTVGCSLASVAAGALWGVLVTRVRISGYRDAVEGRPAR